MSAASSWLISMSTGTRRAAYLQHALTSGEHPRLAALVAEASPDSQQPPVELADRYPDLIARVLTGLLGPT